MRVPMDWLSEWINVPVPVEEFAEQLTMSGLEVEEIEKSGPDLSGIRVLNRDGNDARHGGIGDL